MNKTEKEKLITLAKRLWDLGEADEDIGEAFGGETKRYYNGKASAYKGAARDILKAIEELTKEESKND